MNHIEIEVKSLLGTEASAEELKKKILAEPYTATPKEKNKQRNHYFLNGDFLLAEKALTPFFDDKKREKLHHILQEGKNHSVRTRSVDDRRTLFVIKASLGDDTSQNGVLRIEFEEEVSGLDLDALDRILLDAGFAYQAKWSREREEYVLSDGTTVCLDKNAGYGYLAEFERLADNPSQADIVKTEIFRLMSHLGVVELPQDRLERMFAYYNAHWSDYYGTDKIFVVD